MKFLENTKIIVNLSIILTTLSVVYFLVVLANLKAQEIDIKNENRVNFDICIDQALKEYRNQWNFQCKENKKSENCSSLPGIFSSKIIDDLKEDKINCAKLYK